MGGERRERTLPGRQGRWVAAKSPRALEHPPWKLAPTRSPWLGDANKG